MHDNTDQDVVGTPGGGTGIIVNAFLEVEAVGRGESLVGNDVIANTVRRNVGSGISNLSNVGATVERNVVEHNGFRPDGSLGLTPGNGMGAQRLFAAVHETMDVVRDNLVRDSANEGIVVNSNANQVVANRVEGSVADGILINGEANRIARNTVIGSGDLDLSDAHPDCDSNVWRANRWSGPVSPHCVTIGGSGPGRSPAGQPVPATQTSVPGLRRDIAGR